MKQTIDGVSCDTENAKLIARESNGEQKDLDVGEVYSTELYRTVMGRFFVYRYFSFGHKKFELLSRTAAMDLYEALPAHKLDFDEAFDDLA